MKRIILICTEQYNAYAEMIQSTYKNVEVYGGYDIEKGVSETSKINPGAVIFLNYYKPQEYESGLAIENIRRIRSVTENQIIVLSGERPSTEFIVQADEYSNVKVLWGKEIDIDIDNIPETELPNEPRQDIVSIEDEEGIQDETNLEDLDHNQDRHDVPEEDNENGGYIEPEENVSFDSQLNEYRKVIVCVDDFLDLITVPYFSVDRLEAIPANINETTKAVITTSSILSAGGSFAAVKAIIKKIPKSVKLYAVDNTRLNQLIYGEIGAKEGVKFYPVDQIDEIFKDIDGVQPEAPPAEISEKAQIQEQAAEPAHEDKKKFRLNFGNISEKISNVVEATKSIPRPEIKIPKLQFKDVGPKQKESKKIEFIERNKILLMMSPISTGKTEIASNLAACLADDGLKTALIDLDMSKKGCFYNFPLFEKEHLFILRKVFIHLEDSGGLEDTIESYAYRIGNLHVYTSHRDVEVQINKAVLKSFLRHLKASFDVIVIDVGKDLPKEVLEVLMDTDGIKKYLVTTQSIEHLNTIPYCYKWFLEFPLYYKSWTLLVNRYLENGGVSDSDIGLYFEDPEQGSELSFEINKTYNIPDSSELQHWKSKRSILYSKDKIYSEGIKNIVDDWKKGE